MCPGSHVPQTQAQAWRDRGAAVEDGGCIAVLDDLAPRRPGRARVVAIDYGPERLGGNPDDLALQARGNLWTTLIGAGRLVAITPEGES